MVAWYTQSDCQSSSATDQGVEGFSAIGTYLIHIVLIVLGLVLPVFELLVWISDGVDRRSTFVSQWDAAFATLLLSSLGALITLIMVLSPAWLYVQRSSVYKNAVYLSSALQEYCWHLD